MVESNGSLEVCMKLKTTKGFSLVELMVVTAILGVLTTISIPFYGQYKKSTRKGAMQYELVGLQKAWINFSMSADDFCEDADGNAPSIKKVGQKSLMANYGTGTKTPNFIGFGKATCISSAVFSSTSNDSALGVGAKNSSTADKDEDCELESGNFTMGAFKYVGQGTWQPMSVTDQGVLTNDKDDEETSPSDVNSTCV